MSDDPRDAPPQDLMSDEDYVALMAARHKKAGKPMDEVGAARAWSKLEGRLGDAVAPKRARWPLAGAMLAVAAVGAFFVLGRGPGGGPDGGRLDPKSGAAGGVKVAIVIDVADGDGHHFPPDQPLPGGVTVNLAARAEGDPGYVTLVDVGAAHGLLAPAALRPAGEATPLGAFDAMAVRGKTLCVLAAATREEVDNLVRHLQELAPELPATQCQRFAP